MRNCPRCGWDVSKPYMPPTKASRKLTYRDTLRFMLREGNRPIFNYLVEANVWAEDPEVAFMVREGFIEMKHDGFVVTPKGTEESNKE